MNYSSYGGGGRGPITNFSGNVDAYAAQLPQMLHFNSQASASQALASAVALPDVYTEKEYERTLCRNNGDVMKAALQLREKYAFRKKFHFLELNVGLPTIQEELRMGYAHLLDVSDPEGCPVLLLQMQYFKPGFGDGQKLHRQGRGAADGSAVSSLEDARRLCVYLMDLAVEMMEEREAPGIIFLIDVAHCTLANLEAKMVTDLLQMCKNWYPEVVKRVMVLNSSTFARVLTMLLAKLTGARTQQRIRVVNDPRELTIMLPRTAIPQHYGGEYQLVHPNIWLKNQAELEGVDLNAAYVAQDQEDEEETGYGLEEREVDPNESLNGMQYANVSAVGAAEMPNSVLRGPLMRKKMDGVWSKHFALLRPEALLLYENTTGARPVIIIPVNCEVRVVAATFADRPKGCGFRVEVPGIVGGHELVASTEQERGNWLQEMQWAINNNKEKLERREEREERRAKIHRDFEALNMISFDMELPVANDMKTRTTAQQQQVRPPQPVDMLGLSMPAPTPMATPMHTGPMPNMMRMMQPQGQAGMSISNFAFQQQQQHPSMMPMQQPMAMQTPMAMGMQPQQPMVMGMQPMGMGMQPMVMTYLSKFIPWHDLA
ncbi:hypothetical protein BBO99_00005661 [Phytophthora kernoviae]|uniref:CRAL-TRIO domain-containing protein n=2 Tax=Phytophthora kernoviae TaxID=325452 RepID=A0A3R7GVT2_9STRA|nr:hypothetical protein G195_005573 [Phytophthora kernoviae 00238/432]KAG2511687.1 hypothetical protein JM18_008642 [Phytophthora kernoviae]KAG2519601.1 hypothetical protein JM16_006006 [Phytophthora kernoviae]RLN44961.1 hypothetical protein BBI17_005698 [Phytophthora kernoviae]RLN78876.1 hypothetical protein BBO99_00005661 [Phytophthora kernoviae]